MALDLNVTSVGTGAAGALAKTAKAAAAGPAASFADSLGSLIDGVEQAQAGANTAVTGMLDKTGEVHDAMIALQRAEMSLELTVQIRNKLVQAYQDVMRMPI
jgi:flagellar hook-basal body complex protein FliE